MISKNNKESPLFSLRNSVLVWVAGIMLGWGIAVIGVYQWIKSSNNGRVVAGKVDPILAQARDANTLSQIEPAAGNTSNKNVKNKQ